MGGRRRSGVLQAPRRRRCGTRAHQKRNSKKICRHERASGRLHQCPAHEKQHAAGYGRRHLYGLCRARCQAHRQRRRCRDFLSHVTSSAMHGLSAIAVALILVLAGGKTAGAGPVRIAYSSISGAMLPLWIAKDKGLFDKYGVEVELAYTRGVAIEALLSGEVHFVRASPTGGSSLNAPWRRSRHHCEYHQRRSFLLDVETRPEKARRP